MTNGQKLLQALIPDERGAAQPQSPRSSTAVAWARVSTDMQGDRGLSIPGQLKEIAEFAACHGFEIVREYTEVASAYQDEKKRIEFRRMLDHVKAEGISAILVRDFSRFSRDSLRARTLVRELQKSGVRVVSITEPEADPDTVAGVYLEAITHAKNEAYSREVAFHTRRGCRANVQARDGDSGWCFKNGGQPLWGYKTQLVARGTDGRDARQSKAIWVRDSEVVAGRPVHEWVRHCFVELAGQGASLTALVDFCERTGLPARRKSHWGTSTWNALLQPHVLMKYCGFEVWNVHRKNGSIRPKSEWVIVENAHEAILTPEEVQGIANARRRTGRSTFFLAAGRSRVSPYLLSGGLFKCGRCGANMTGLRGTSGVHYICGSLPYRRGRGCGPGVYVPVRFIESEVVRELRELLARCTDPKAFARLVNQELAEGDPGAQQVPLPAVESQIADVEARVARVRKAIEEGLQDVAWANERLAELTAERARLEPARTAPPRRSGSDQAHRKVTATEAMALRRDVERLLAVGTLEEKKQLLRIWVAEMKLAPEAREVQVTFRAPEPVMHKLVAGAGFEPATFGL